MNLFRIKTRLRRWINGKLKFEHFSSAPFLSGDTFRSISNHAYDEFSNIKPADVQRGDIVFVKNNFLKDFFAKTHKKIQHPYILVNHNDDTTIDESYIQLIDDKIIHWFGLNIDVEHPKMTPLPIGLENISYRRNGLLKYFLKSETTLGSNKDSNQHSGKVLKSRINKILVAFHTNKVHPERLEAFTVAKDHPLTEVCPITQNHAEYIEKVGTYNFILSPRGAGVDCHRTWEALYLGTTPIVRTSANTKFFKSIGIPMVLVDQWSDLQTLDISKALESLNELNSQQKPTSDSEAWINGQIERWHPALYIEYWIQLIHNKRI